MIAIVDYGMGNNGSIKNMFKKIGVNSIITDNAEDLVKAEKIILPGVGKFDNGINNLKKMGLTEILNKKVIDEKTPILGICLGMQLMSEISEEGGNLHGLGWVDAEVRRFDFNRGQNKDLKIPHMGWNTVKHIRKHSLFSQMFEKSRFYFVHSYYMVCRDPYDIVTTTYHGMSFVSTIAKDNIFGVQFHPEKSHKFGMKLLSNFAVL